VTLDAPRKGLQKNFNIQRLWINVQKNYKTLFIKVFHILVHLIILKLQYFLNKHTPNILLHILYPKRNSNELY